jgi:hypothetical protein
LHLVLSFEEEAGEFQAAFGGHDGADVGGAAMDLDDAPAVEERAGASNQMDFHSSTQWFGGHAGEVAAKLTLETAGDFFTELNSLVAVGHFQPGIKAEVVEEESGGGSHMVVTGH